MRRGGRTPIGPALGLALAVAMAGPTGQALAAPAGHPAATRHAATHHSAHHSGSTHAKKPPPPAIAFPPRARGAGVAIAMAPVGLSIEYPTMAADLGSGPCPPAALVSTLQALGSPPISLAGDSQDLTAPPGALSAPPSSWETATLYPLPGAFWNQMHCLLATTHDPLTIGLNAKTGQPGWAAQMVAGAQSAVAGTESSAAGTPGAGAGAPSAGTATNGLSYSLGNEPDLYYLPNYTSLSRPVPDEEAAAANTYLQVASTLRAAVGSAPVIGPELARPAGWRAQLPRVIASLPAQTVGVHAYPLSACATPKAVTIKGVLSARAADEPQRLRWVVADAAAAHVPAIVSEANSASCGGVAGVSDTPATAVWAVRFVLSALQAGFQEVRFHFSGAPYDPFVVQGESVLARPLEGAMVALNRLLPVGATLRTLPGVRGLQASSISAPPTTAPGAPTSPGQSTIPTPTSPQPVVPRTSTTTVILDNTHARVQQAVLRGVRAVRVQTFTPARAGLSVDLVSPHNRIRLTVPANSVVAVSAP
jgi:hypothetical protein